LTKSGIHLPLSSMPPAECWPQTSKHWLWLGQHQLTSSADLQTSKKIGDRCSRSPCKLSELFAASSLLSCLQDLFRTSTLTLTFDFGQHQLTSSPSSLRTAHFSPGFKISSELQHSLWRLTAAAKQRHGKLGPTAASNLHSSSSIFCKVLPRAPTIRTPETDLANVKDQDIIKPRQQKDKTTTTSTPFHFCRSRPRLLQSPFNCPRWNIPSRGLEIQPWFLLCLAQYYTSKLCLDQYYTRSS